MFTHCPAPCQSEILASLALTHLFPFTLLETFPVLFDHVSWLSILFYIHPLEADQCTHNEGEHENRQPSCQHEEEPCASDHPV